MKLARKFALALALGILVVMVVHAWVLVRQESSFFETDLQAQAHRGQAMFLTLQTLWRTDGPERTRQLVDEVGAMMRGDATRNLHARWTRLDAPPGDPRLPALAPDERVAVADGQVLRVTRRDEHGEVWRYVYVPMAPGDPNVLEVSQSLQRELTFIQTSTLAIAATTVVIVAVCGLIAVGLGRRVVGRPLEMVRDKARRMGAGDFSGRLVVHQRDEIGELAQEMNVLSDRLADARDELAAQADARIAMLEQLRHTDRLATVGQLASGIAHELGTPLSVISARARLLADGDASQTEAAATGRTIVEQAGRMTAIIRQLLDFSRRRGPQLGVADLQQLARRVVDLLSPLAKARHVSLELAASPAPRFGRVDQNQIQQALANVVVNGIQAMPNGGRLHVEVTPRQARPPARHGGAEGEHLCVTVRDEGTGIPAELIPRIFEPFFTTKGVGEGTGLGLSVAYGIVAEHGGWIDVESTVGTGTSFRIFLPAAASGTQVEAAS